MYMLVPKRAKSQCAQWAPLRAWAFLVSASARNVLFSSVPIRAKVHYAHIHDSLSIFARMCLAALPIRAMALPVRVLALPFRARAVPVLARAPFLPVLLRALPLRELAVPVHKLVIPFLTMAVPFRVPELRGMSSGLYP